MRTLVIRNLVDCLLRVTESSKREMIGKFIQYSLLGYSGFPLNQILLNYFFG